MVLKNFIPSEYKKNAALYDRAALMVNVVLLTALIASSLTLLGLYIEYKFSLIVMPISGICFASLPLLIKRKVNLDFIGNLFVLISSIVIVLMICYSGGIYSPVTPWIAAGPTFALLVNNRKSAWIWSIIMFMAICFFAVLEFLEQTPAIEYNQETKPLYYFVVYSSLIFIMLMINLIFEKNKKDALLKVEEANKNITASINYARRIQNAILPSSTELNKMFPEHFVMYQPKDIISGDFYWTAHVEGKRFIAAADCTGHGVPGALMSMIGNELLNKIIFEKKIYSAEKILNELHNDLCFAFKQSASEVKDGMDILLCVFSTNSVEFSGAKNSLYYFQNRELHTITGNREAIGGDNLSRDFKKHEIPNISGTTIYLCSDGLQDQFGGDKGKKFTIGKLKKSLTELNNIEFNTQKNKLEDILRDWKKEEEQTDDILVLGIKI